MKKGKFGTIVLLGSALMIPAYADKVQLQQLPSSVQDKIRAQVGSAEINDIDRDIRNGQYVYEVGFKQNGQQTEMHFDQNGNLMGSNANAAKLDSRKLTKSELPVRVRRVVNSRLQGMEINDIERQVKNGQVTYGVGYKQAGGVGPQQELVLSDTGSIIRSSAGLSDSVASSSAPVASAAAPVAESAIPSRTISYDELPQTVRKVAESNLHYGGVKRVERQMRNGEIDYVIDFLKDNGQHQEMTISEDGRILQNQMLAGTGVGAPGTTQSGTSSSTVNTNNQSLWNRLGQTLFNQQ
jgi:uncharacterized membrane protein YkoI